MAAGDIYEVIIQQDFLTEVGLNVFFYETTNATGSALELAQQFETDVLPAWIALVNDGLFFDTAFVRNLFNPDDAAAYPLGQSGVGVGEALPSFISLYASFTPDRASINNARKMFGGLSEDNQNNGNWSTATQTAWAQIVNTEFLQTLLNVNSDPTYQPIVVKRIKYTTPNGNIAYRLPILPSEADTGVLIAGTASPRVRTQRSRKNFD